MMHVTLFQNFWTEHFGDLPPISHLFKHLLSDRWVRIHSLPEAKRYASTPAEWSILFKRQNTIFEEFLAPEEEIYVLTGIYSTELAPCDATALYDLPFQQTIDFQQLTSVDMYQLSQKWVDEDTVYTPFVAATRWQPSTFQPVLQAVANDEWRLFFLAPKSNTIIAPYDGGMDIILNKATSVAAFKSKYQDWLSRRDDGL
jgi:hypothetical protein